MPHHTTPHHTTPYHATPRYAGTSIQVSAPACPVRAKRDRQAVVLYRKFAGDVDQLLPNDRDLQKRGHPQAMGRWAQESVGLEHPLSGVPRVLGPPETGRAWQDERGC